MYRTTRLEDHAAHSVLNSQCPNGGGQLSRPVLAVWKKRERERERETEREREREREREGCVSRGRAQHPCRATSQRCRAISSSRLAQLAEGQTIGKCTRALAEQMIQLRPRPRQASSGLTWGGAWVESLRTYHQIYISAVSITGSKRCQHHELPGNESMVEKLPDDDSTEYRLQRPYVKHLFHARNLFRLCQARA